MFVTAHPAAVDARDPCSALGLGTCAAWGRHVGRGRH